MRRKGNERLEKGTMVRLSLEDRAWLDQVSDKDDRTLSAYVRKLIRRGREGSFEALLEACKKVADLAKAGKVVDQPTMELLAATIKRAEGK